MIQLKKKLFKGVLRLAFLFCVFSTTNVHSQITFDDDVDDGTPAAPIDGLLGLGLAAGAYYGIRKIIKKDK